MTHIPVMLEQAVDVLVHRLDGFYIDCTFGRGGHSAAILSKLSDQGRLMVIDKDPEAIAVAQASMGHDARVSIVQGSFAQIKDHVAASSVEKVDGILLDLGVSSNQLDVAERGFSFGKPGPLDMRMDNSAGETAAEWLNRASGAEGIWRGAACATDCARHRCCKGGHTTANDPRFGAVGCQSFTEP